MKKTGLFLVGLVVAASTVYAVALRPSTGPASESAVAASATAPALLAARAEPRTWGRLVVLDEPTVSPGFSMVIRTPPIVISAPPPKETEPVAGRLVATEPNEHGGGVMARFKASPPVRPDLPEAPDRASITKVMGSVRTEIQECYDRGMVPGQVDLVLTVEGRSGEVQKARVSATSSTATCIQRVARTLRFPRFAKESITIRYPYSFR